MPRKPNENYHEYKERIIDPVSPSFCAAKWYNATIWLGQGKTTSCHHPSPHEINIEEIKTNPSAIHNTAIKKLLRKEMLEGKRPDECAYCWKVEDIGRGNVSDRTFKTVIYKDEEIQKIATDPWDTNVNLKTLEIAFDRTCNFACSYCNASFSTTWAKDIKINGPYTGLVSDDAPAFTQDGSWAEPYKDKSTNPYIKAFWDWWPELSHSLDELRITGGEPLMSDDVWKLFDMFKRDKLDHIRLAINSNLGGKDALIERMIEASHNIHQFDIYTSIEATGAQAEYIRDGLEFDRWTRNVERVLSEGRVRRFHFMMTINALCLFSITEVMDQIVAWKHKYNRIGGGMGMSFNILRYPSFMSPLILPQNLKDQCKANLQAWHDRHQDDKAYEMHERDAVQRLIDYLDAVNAPQYKEFNRIGNEQDFKNFYQQYDVRREKSIRVFPEEFLRWYDGISTNKIIPIKQV